VKKAAPKDLELAKPVAKDKRHIVKVSLSESEFQQASIAARESNQTVAEWIADMVYTSTQP
jgi:hypothetical protein